MLGKFWEGFGEQLAERWVSTVVAPSFLFWCYGFLSWTIHIGWHNMVSNIKHLDESLWWVVLVGGLLLVLASSLVVQMIVLPVLRLLEGYFPLWLMPLHQFLVEQERTRIKPLHERYKELGGKQYQVTTDKQVVHMPLSREEQEEFVYLEQQLQQVPSDPNDIMPTRLGNILRAAERHSLKRYGLDAIVCWQRLWLVMPDTARKEIGTARTNLDTTIRAFIWGALLVVWAWWGGWLIPISIALATVVMWGSYKQALQVANIYGDLIESAFDLYRMDLYDALNLPRPANSDEEIASGKRLTQYLYRGAVGEKIAFR